MTGHIWWLGLIKYVTSQRIFCGLCRFICGNFDVFPNHRIKDNGIVVQEIGGQLKLLEGSRAMHMGGQK